LAEDNAEDAHHRAVQRQGEGPVCCRMTSGVSHCLVGRICWCSCYPKYYHLGWIHYQLQEPSHTSRSHEDEEGVFVPQVGRYVSGWVQRQFNWVVTLRTWGSCWWW
jgi:hypothetical protein